MGFSRRRFLFTGVAAATSAALQACGGGSADGAQFPQGQPPAPGPTPPTGGTPVTPPTGTNPVPPAVTPTPTPPTTPPPATVVPSPINSKDLWGPEYDYNALNWRLYRRDYATQLTSADGVGHAAAEYNFPLRKAKDNVAIYRPTSGRVYTFGGDQSMWSMNLEGFSTSSSSSNNVIFASFSETNPTWIAREAGYPNSPSEMYAQIDDCPSGMYDSVSDRLLYMYNSTFGTEWDGQATISSVALVNATTARFPSSVTAVPVGTKLKFLMTVGANANVFKRGRVAAVKDAGGGQVEVTLTWWDTMLNFQNPAGVVISKPENRHSSPTGAWQEVGLSGEYYNESTGKWYAAVMSMDFTTRQISRLLFEVAARGECSGERWSAQFLPASATGRGPEVWSFSGGSWLASAAKFDFATMRATKYTTGLPQTSATSYATATNMGCSDAKGNIFFVAPESSPVTNLVVCNVRGAAPSFTLVPTDYPARLVNTTMPWVSYRMVWNEEIQRIELYCMDSGGSIVDGNCTIFLINPYTRPAKVERVGNTDANGRKISGSTVVQVATTGTSAAHTWMMGGAAAEAATLEACSRSRVFIAANRRKWEELTPGPHWYQAFTKFNPKATDDSTAHSQIAQVPTPCFGNWVPETDSNGNNTGKVFIRAGGDGDYGGNEVTILRLDQLSGTTYPTQLNTVTSAADFANWHQRIRTGFQQGSTTGASELLINPANPAEWAPVSIHTQFINSFVPGYGYVEDWISPTSLSTGGPRHLRSAYKAVNGSLSVAINDSSYSDGNWGNSFGMAQQLGGVSSSLNVWSDTGGNAGKWQRAFVSGTGGRRRLACFNPTRNLLLGYTEQSDGQAVFFEWTPGQPDFAEVKRMAAGEVINNDPGWTSAINPGGSNASAIWWLEGDDYLIYRRYYSQPVTGFLKYNRATRSMTRLRTSTGSPILDAHFAAGKEGTAVVHRANREVIWVLFNAPSSAATLALYRSSFDDLMNLRPMYVSNSSQTFNIGPDSQVASVGIKNGLAINGWLYLMTVGGAQYAGSNIKEAKVHRLPIY